MNIEQLIFQIKKKVNCSKDKTIRDTCLEEGQIQIIKLFVLISIFLPHETF